MRGNLHKIMNSKNTKKLLFILSFLLPIIIMFIVYALLNQWPLGEKSLIVDWDIKEQYSNYFAYLKTVLKGENNFIYSFSKVLGGDFIGLAGYYLLSPFNILFLILDNLKLEIVIFIITLLKLGASGLTFNLFISKKFKVSYYNLLFSTSYALMAYNIVYQQNLMWLDGIILLPLVILGIDNIIEDKSFLLYAISLALAIFSNYYIGYMIGIISIIYFFYAISFKIKIPLKENLKKY